MDSRRRSVLSDNFLALFGIVRSGPESPPAVKPLAATTEPVPATPTRVELDDIGRQLGFDVSTDGLWRLEDWVVATRLKLRGSGALNDLPGRIGSMRASGQVRDDDVVVAFYVYEEATPAMESLFDSIMEHDDRTPVTPYMIGIDALRHLRQQVRAKHMSQFEARDVLLRVENSAAGL